MYRAFLLWFILCCSAQSAGPIKLDGMMKHLEAFQAVGEKYGDRSIYSAGFNMSANYVLEMLAQTKGYFGVAKQPVVVASGAIDFQQAAKFSVNGRSYNASNSMISPTVINPPLKPGFLNVSGVVWVPDAASDACLPQTYTFGAGAPVYLEDTHCIDQVLQAILQRQPSALFFPLKTPRFFVDTMQTKISKFCSKHPVPLLVLTNAKLSSLMASGNASIELRLFFRIHKIAHSFNIIASSVQGDPTQCVISGSHLDSVPAGPGINDNGSGSAFNLELALHLARNRVALTRQLRIVWFTAEEQGLFGSKAYVDNLHPNQRLSVLAMLNYDMIASPNAFYGVYNGSSTGNEMDENIQRILEAAFTERGAVSTPTAFTGRSDYGPFLEAGIPSGGLFSGAEELLDVQTRDNQGFGSANVALDSCYHQPCDTLANINKPVYDMFAQVAYTAIQNLTR